MSKPVVTYTGPASFSSVGECETARVYALDHPRLGCCKVYTSHILKHNEDGSFETMNTIYKPYSPPEDVV